MSLRTWVYQSLANDRLIQARFKNRIFTSGAVGAQSNAEKPFLIFRAGTENIGLRKTSVITQSFYVYVHVDPRSALAIDDGLDLVSEALRVRAPQRFSGGLVMESQWTGTSDDLYDDILETATRFATFEITAALGTVR